MKDKSYAYFDLHSLNAMLDKDILLKLIDLEGFIG
jgi:hypothetical protein